MIPIDFQVSRSKVEVKGHASLLHLMQLITRECFAPEASNLVSRYLVVLDEYMTTIDNQVSRSKVSVGQAYSLYVGEGGH